MIAQESARVDISSVPSHVPTDLVQPYDMLRVSGSEDDPFKVMNSFRQKGPIFYTPTHFCSPAGAWVLTRGEDIRTVMQNPEMFSSKGVSGFSRLLGETWDMIPLELDPPQHSKFRMLLNPLFAPNQIAKLEQGIRESCVDLIEKIVDAGECDFVDYFAKSFPVRIILQLMGWPQDHFDQFMKWEAMLLQGDTMETRIAAASGIRDYLADLIVERRRNPTDDLTSFAVNARVDGNPLSDDEILGILYLLFVGGLDTVTSSLGFYFRYLAENPQQQRKLRENPALIPEAIEELLRAHSVVMVSRFATADTEIAGAKVKKGDCFAIYTTFASLDPNEFSEPECVNFQRTANRHIAFAFGPHRCLGSHLARRELVIAIQEWTKRIPEFRIKPNAVVKMHGGVVFGVDTLPLVWDKV
jgi:cytochrome P450